MLGFASQKIFLENDARRGVRVSKHVKLLVSKGISDEIS